MDFIYQTLNGRLKCFALIVYKSVKPICPAFLSDNVSVNFEQKRLHCSPHKHKQKHLHQIFCSTTQF